MDRSIYRFIDPSIDLSMGLIIRQKPLFLIPLGSLNIISAESSLRHKTCGKGYPRALHVSLTLPPSGTIMSPDVSSGMKSGGTTTSKYPNCNLIN